MMINHNFNEKTEEFSSKRGEKIPVWQSPKYFNSKRKAIEIIDSQKYDLSDADFWILMNETKSGKMAYDGLIISHNGCLKINDALTPQQKFNPACVTVDKEGYGGALVYTYCNPEQGLYEVGEVSSGNCKNKYPYAMAYKRLFDRVVLKLSKLAYSGILSDSEADEFVQRLDAAPEETCCSDCGTTIKDSKKRNGEFWPASDIISFSQNMFGRALCPACQRKAHKGQP